MQSRQLDELVHPQAHGHLGSDMDLLERGLQHLQLHDAALIPLIDRYADEIVVNRRPGFESLTKIVINQQLSNRVAQTIFHRLKLLFGGEEITPRHLLTADAKAIGSAGISPQKVKCLTNLAVVVSSDPEFLVKLSNIPD